MFRYAFLLIIISFALCSCEERFETLSDDKTYSVSLMENIQSGKKIDYLRIDLMYGGSPFKKSEYGNYKRSLEIPLSKDENGGRIFAECQPSYCGYRIAYIENDQWNFVANEEELKLFIGKIDNEYEAFLIAKINGYEIDTVPEGNGFKKTNFGYKLKVMKYEICPQTKQSFIIHVYKNGDYKEIKTLDVYYRSHCIVY